MERLCIAGVKGSPETFQVIFGERLNILCGRTDIRKPQNIFISHDKTVVIGRACFKISICGLRKINMNIAYGHNRLIIKGRQKGFCIVKPAFQFISFVCKQYKQILLMVKNFGSITRYAAFVIQRRI